MERLANFYPRSPCGERPMVGAFLASSAIFLSTLSLRRATLFSLLRYLLHHDFYPRSPCGERLNDAINGCNPDFISIHALLAESDLMWYQCNTVVKEFLSTLSLRRATTSILHKILADWDFYPRSPCGERLWQAAKALDRLCISIHALLAESDFGRAVWPGLSF